MLPIMDGIPWMPVCTMAITGWVFVKWIFWH